MFAFSVFKSLISCFNVSQIFAFIDRRFNNLLENMTLANRVSNDVPVFCQKIIRSNQLAKLNIVSLTIQHKD